MIVLTEKSLPPIKPFRVTLRFTLRTVFNLLTCAAILIAVPAAIYRARFAPAPPDWRYNEELHQVIATADHIDVRHGILQADTDVSDLALLFTVNDIREIADVNANLQFLRNQYKGNCRCVGLIRIQWYKGKKLLATTALMHGRSLRWEAMPGNIAMTSRSAKWIKDWLVNHGVSRTMVAESTVPRASRTPLVNK